MALVFDARPETQALVELLAAMSPGVLLTFGQLSAAAGVPDIRREMHLIRSARAIAEREHGVVYQNEKTVGYRRLRTDQMPEIEVRAANHQRNVARQTIRTLTRGVERANDVPVEVQGRLNAALARQGIIARLTARRMLQGETRPAGGVSAVPEIAERLLQRARPQQRRAAATVT